MSSSAAPFYIGLCSTYHDPALAIVDPAGETLFAEATERFLQYKRGLNCEPDNPFLIDSLLKTHCRGADRFVISDNWAGRRPAYEWLARSLRWLTPKAIRHYSGRQLTAPLPTWELNHMLACQSFARQRAGLNLARTLRQHHPGTPIEWRHFDHHHAHAALACYGSPFESAACAIIDSYGESGSLAFFEFRNRRLTPLFSSRGPQSLGFFYMKLTELCGFDWMAGEEWKVMGLAAYGETDEALLALMHRLMRVEGLDIRLDRSDYFHCLKALEAYRRPMDAPAERVANLAHTGQLFFTRLVNQLLSNLQQATGMANLVLGGGCALNSACNGQILEATPFQSLHIPSAPADDGTALGVALLAWHRDHPDQPSRQEPLSPYLGHAMEESAVARFARYSGLPVKRYEGEQICEATARLLTQGKIVGWIQGRAEYGPRALGNRSLLADPRDPAMMDRINERVKFREPFRPYAPAILDERGSDWFEHYQVSPYMDRTLRFRPEVRSRIPAVVHADGTGRLQSVRQAWNPRFHALLEAFDRQTGIPILMNTSFNVMGKPIVHAPEEAFGVFMGSGLDALVIGDHLFTQPGASP